LKKERERKKIGFDDMASKLGLPAEEYKEIEEGNSPAETWGPRLGKIAIKLETPTSRLLADSGKSADCKPGQAAELIRKHRERRQRTVEELAEYIEVSKEEYEQIEAGQSGIEKYGPLLLHLAEIVELPVFNFFNPFGIWFTNLDAKDYI
jgi:transcriptional regulator with XRE-family HTH domain